MFATRSYGRYCVQDINTRIGAGKLDVTLAVDGQDTNASIAERVELVTKEMVITFRIIDVVFGLDYGTTNLTVLNERLRARLNTVGIATSATIPIDYRPGSVIAAITALTGSVDEWSLINATKNALSEAVVFQMQGGTDVARNDKAQIGKMTRATTTTSAKPREDADGDTADTLYITFLVVSCPLISALFWYICITRKPRISTSNHWVRPRSRDASVSVQPYRRPTPTL